jgi:hypothetical protein
MPAPDKTNPVTSQLTLTLPPSSRLSVGGPVHGGHPRHGMGAVAGGQLSLTRAGLEPTSRHRTNYRLNPPCRRVTVSATLMQSEWRSGLHSDVLRRIEWLWLSRRRMMVKLR